MRVRMLALLPVAGIMLAACGVPLQIQPEPLPSDVVPTSLHVQTPAPSISVTP